LLDDRSGALVDGPSQVRPIDDEAYDTHASQMSSKSGSGAQVSVEAVPPEHRYGDGKAQSVEFYVRDGRGRRVSRLSSLAEYEVLVRIEANSQVRDLCVGILLRTARGAEIFGADSLSCHKTMPALQAGETTTFLATFRNN